jgi:maleylacetate reductase
MKPVLYEYTALSRVRLGMPLMDALHIELGNDSNARIFVVISHSLSQQSDVMAAMSQALGSRLVGVFNRVRSHSPREDVMAALAQASDAETDIIVAIGGGSVIDACKVLQFCLNSGVRTEQQLQRYAQFSDGTRGDLCGKVPPLVRPRPVFQISVPTTLSGAEFSNNAGIMDTVKGAKEGYKAPGLCAKRIIYDPWLALRTPDWLWLSTAIRSLDHAIEGYCSADAHAYVQGQFLHAMRLFSESLPAMKSAPGDVAVRLCNQQATWLACAGLGNIRHGASHGIGYILGGMCGVPHGYTSCLMLPAVLSWNEEINAAAQREIGLALGSGDKNTAQWLKSWLMELELPVSLKAFGIEHDKLSAIANAAARHNVVRSNPRPINSADDVMQILEQAW